MKPTHATTIKNINDFRRIGPHLKRKDQENSFIIKAEQIFEEKAPLPISFDVNCGQPLYFTEFTYTDVMGGLYLKTQNTEVNARVAEQAVIRCEDETYPSNAKEYLNDKYDLKKLPYEAPEKVVFLAGSNLLRIENREMLLPMLWGDPSVAIKPHPNLTGEGFIDMGSQYGWDKLIDPKVSGHDLLNGCKVAFSTSNSEMGIIATVLKKPHADITSVYHFERLTYSAIHRLFEPMNVDRNYKTFARLFNSPQSGFIPPWATNIEERVDGFIKLSMEIRDVFRPSFPDVKQWTSQTTNINKGRSKNAFY